MKRDETLMIYVDIRGNLGNQLFIYSFARALQEVTGQEICFNTFFLQKYFPSYKFSLTEFKLNSGIQIENKKKLPVFMNVYSLPVKLFKRIIRPFPKLDVRLSRIMFKVFSNFGIFIWEKERYIDIPIKKHNNYYISGFFQNEKYFESISSLIKVELSPRANISNENKNLFALIENSDSICVTIRRGDYVSDKKLKKIFSVTDNEYFYEGVQKIKKFFPEAKVICFSDDINWVKKNLNFGCPTYYESGKDSLGEKIRLMSACKHFVISNSSFSWWASYLSTRDGMTIAPSKWYADGRSADIYRSGWYYVD